MVSVQCSLSKKVCRQNGFHSPFRRNWAAPTFPCWQSGTIWTSPPPASLSRAPADFLIARWAVEACAAVQEHSRTLENKSFTYCSHELFIFLTSKCCREMWNVYPGWCVSSATGGLHRSVNLQNFAKREDQYWDGAGQQEHRDESEISRLWRLEPMAVGGLRCAGNVIREAGTQSPVFSIKDW